MKVFEYLRDDMEEADFKVSDVFGNNAFHILAMGHDGYSDGKGHEQGRDRDREQDQDHVHDHDHEHETIEIMRKIPILLLRDLNR